MTTHDNHDERRADDCAECDVRDAEAEAYWRVERKTGAPVVDAMTAWLEDES